MNYLDAVLFLLDGNIEKGMSLADSVEDMTGSEAARVGAIVILVPLCFVSIALGLLMLVAAAPFYVAWAVGAMVWMAAKKGWGAVRKKVPQ